MSDGVTIVTGDMREALAGMAPESVHAIVTDPPYGLEFMGKQWDQCVPGADYWRACLRVAKPGAYLLAFGGTRTAHRLACAIEDAGWELRDCVCWLYGSGFPKSHDISKAIDRELGAIREVVGKSPYAFDRPTPRAIEPGGGLRYQVDERLVTAPATQAAQQWDGWGTALKPAYEPVYIARKPFKGTVAQCVLEHGCGGLNIDGCRIGGDARPLVTSHRGNGNITYGEGLHGSRAIGETALGRWPANLVLDERAAEMLDAQTGELTTGGGLRKVRDDCGLVGFKARALSGYEYPASTGGASRFFYTAKASRSEREAGLDHFTPAIVNDGRDTPIDNPYQRGDTLRKCTHPTVKPISLMRWLVRLVTPPGGTVLDPFAGSGSTGVASVLEGARFIGVELSPEYAELATARIAHASDEDDGPQLALFDRQEITRPVRPAQTSLFDDVPDDEAAQ